MRTINIPPSGSSLINSLVGTFLNLLSVSGLNPIIIFLDNLICRVVS